MQGEPSFDPLQKKNLPFFLPFGLCSKPGSLAARHRHSRELLLHRPFSCVKRPPVVVQAPSRASIIKKLSNGLILNMVGLAATLLGAQATVGLLVAKALTSQSQPYLANTPQGFSPVLALDVFLVQVRR